MVKAELYYASGEGVQDVGSDDAEGKKRTVQEADAQCLKETRLRHEENVALVQRLAAALAKWRQTRAEDELEWFREHQEAEYQAVPVRFAGSEVKVIPVDAAVQIGERRINNQPEADLYA